MPMYSRARRREERLTHAIAERIRQHRINQAISQMKLAKAIGVSFQQVQKYERGKNRIAACKLVVLARELDVPITAFLEGIED